MLDRRFDAGGILYQKVIGIGPDDTFGEVLDRLIDHTPHALDNLLDRSVRGDYSTVSQDEERSSYFRKRTLEDGRIEWAWDARIVHNRVRGLSPRPRARFDFGGGTHTILRSHIRNGLPDARPSGTVVEVSREGHEAAVVCGDGRIIELFGLDPPLALRP
jgi:UDP-4-amino-4-deoxy-L-arabinose formyltransferase/UDP-glucuronic acid dehydrogenase (UDP-4-keto-hexauronic acid decarboxylating)